MMNEREHRGAGATGSSVKTKGSAVRATRGESRMTRYQRLDSETSSAEDSAATGDLQYFLDIEVREPSPRRDV